jgi:hypothetical protein
MTRDETPATPAKQPLLLHICCGPCAVSVIETLRETYSVTGYFCNPNIFPEDEYRRRRDGATIATLRMGVPFIEGPYDPERFRTAVRGFENEPENGHRCPRCYRLRLDETARYAVANGFSLIATTLTTGPRKAAASINPIGEAAADRHGISFLGGDWKKGDGYRRSCELAREFGIYRQNYCGCEHSLRDRH